MSKAIKSIPILANMIHTRTLKINDTRKGERIDKQA